MNRLILILALLAPAPLSGCASFLASLPTIGAVVNDALVVLGVIDAAAQEWMRKHPNEDVREAYLEAYSRTLAALNAANHALSGVRHVSQDDFDRAFAEFSEAFNDLRNVLIRERMMIGDRMSLGGSTVVIPEPEALTFKP